MKSKLLSIFLGLIMIMNHAQIVIGSSNASPAAALKLDSNDKALRIPNLSITSRTDATNPISSPATGVMLYNINSSITNDITKGIGYWGSDSQYHSQATPASADEIVSTSQIPSLIFSAAIGQKPIIASGSAAGGSWTRLSLITSEILFDKYAAWNSTTNQYKTPSSGIYMLEFITDMSNTGNNGGTSTHRILKAAALMVSASGRDSVINNRMYTTLITTQNLTLNDLLAFEYIYTANNYRIQSGTLNIYKYQ
ncbi:hypothetical protein MUU74_11310 [Chryseobacterium daecheongense]|uniref:hypothetical protein n=1 Tax=Chryseobacterium daecheongense TaxID=192389 RepID=UPI001FD709F5|nr:hypothetical protein [Chryseobacterium daecheongense]UOU97081.1 hypothetical protein MUU74_11310 [Chryseobacterium daecheongense]